MDIRALLSGLLDDEIDAPTRHEAERHIASCDACLAMVDEADKLDRLVAQSARAMVPGDLPEGFEGAVLSRTVYDTPSSSYFTRWQTWVGWVAAAAALMLAMTVWIIDRRAGLMPNTGTEGVAIGERDPAITGVYANYNYRRSEVFDGALPLIDREGSSAGENEADAPATEPAHQPAQDLRNLAHRSKVTDNDAQLLYAASLLLERLEAADTESFADVETVRQIAEYDEILPRLASLRSRLEGVDRSIVFASESVLLRAVRGPVSREDMDLIRETVAQMDLARELDAIGTRPGKHSV